MKTLLILITAIVPIYGALGQNDGSLTMVAYDTADQRCYDNGWRYGTGKEISYGGWSFFTELPFEESSAGVYLASPSENERLKSFSKRRAFGLFSIGEGEEKVVAHRNFQGKLWAGDVFSFCMLPESLGGGEADIEGAMGVVFSTKETITSANDYNGGAVLEFGLSKDSKNYLIFDGDGALDTGVEAVGRPVSISFEFLPNGLYKCQIAILGGRIDDVLEVFDMPERKLRDIKNCEKIRSVVFFHRDGGLNDLFFDDIVLDRQFHE